MLEFILASAEIVEGFLEKQFYRVWYCSEIDLLQIVLVLRSIICTSCINFLLCVYYYNPFKSLVTASLVEGCDSSMFLSHWTFIIIQRELHSAREETLVCQIRRY